jgi:hypothetical protein
MISLPFLSDAEIREIASPLKQPAAITRWFADRGFVMKVKPNGLPLIGRTHFDEVMSGSNFTIAENTSHEGPNVQALLDRFTRKGASYGDGKKTKIQPPRVA